VDRERDRGGHDLIPRLRALWRPTPVHYASLVVGFALLLVLGRDQWFVYDDWVILHQQVAWLGSHQGHWNTAATLIFQALRATIGFHSYLPYLAFAFLAHLATVHLLWRVMRRAGVSAWVSTALAVVAIVLGSAAENLMWAFQVGYMGAVAVGLGVVLLVDRRRLSRGGYLLAGALAILALPFSGTALPVLAGAAVLSVVRRGWLRSLALFAPAGVVYLVWYLLLGRTTSAGLSPQGLEWLTAAPVFFAAMFGAGYGEFTGLVLLGPVVAIALAVWLVVQRRRLRTRRAIAFALLLATLVFAALTTATRAGGELSAAGAQRYVWVIVMLAIPTMGLALDALASRGRVWRVVAGILIAVVGVANLGLLIVRTGEQAAFEQRVQRQVSAGLAVVADHPDYPGYTQINLDGAFDINVDDVLTGLRLDLFSPVPYTDADTRQVLDWMGPPPGG
jgi:hypothetical protein